MNKKKIFEIAVYTLLCIVVSMMVSVVLIKFLGKYGLQLSAKSLFLYLSCCVPVVLIFTFMGGYKLYIANYSKVFVLFKKDNFKKLIPNVTLKRFLVSIGVVVGIALFLEIMFTIMELSNPAGTKHWFSIVNVLVWIFVFGILDYFYLLIFGILHKDEPKKERISIGLALLDDNLRPVDYIVFLALGVFCAFSYNQVDLLITAGNSFAILSGHILDFYTYLNEVWGQSNYMITTYFIFALWNIPVRIITGSKYYVPTTDLSIPVVWWNKMLIVLVYIASIYFIFKICKRIGMSSKKARLGAYLYAGSPVGFYSSFIFGQYDVFVTLCIILAIYLLLDNHDILATLCIALGLTFKVTALLFFIPILLIKKKNIVSLMGYLVLSLLPYAVLTVLCSRSEAFDSGVSNFSALSYIIQSRLTIFSNINLTLYVFLIAYIAICGWAYVKKVDTMEDFFKYSIFAGALVTLAFFTLCYHHPQWFLIGSPFISLMILNSKRYKEACLMQTISFTFYLIYVSIFFHNNADIQMVDNGIWHYIVGDMPLLTEFHFWNLSNDLLDYRVNTSLYFTLYAGFFGLSVFYCRPISFVAIDEEPMEGVIGFTRARFLVPVLSFVFVLMICLFYSVPIYLWP